MDYRVREIPSGYGHRNLEHTGLRNLLSAGRQVDIQFLNITHRGPLALLTKLSLAIPLYQSVR